MLRLKFIFIIFSYEIDVISFAIHLKSGLYAFVSFSQKTPLFMTLMIYALGGGKLSPYRIFSLVQFFNILHITAGSLFLRAVNTVSEAIASIKRMQVRILY